MYVGLSNTVLNDIRNQIHTKRRTEFDSRPRPTVNIPVPDMDELDRLFWGPFLDLRTQMPQHWKPFTNAANLYAEVESEHKSGKHLVSLQILLPGGYQVPPHNDGIISACKREVGPNHPWMAPITEHKLWELEVYARWNKVDKTITEFLDKCKSLNEAVKLWPDLMHYIPQDLKNRMALKPEKREKRTDAEDALAKLDTNSVTAAAVIARLYESDAERGRSNG